MKSYYEQWPQVRIRSDMHKRLDSFIEKQFVPPRKVDVVSLALDEFLTRNGE